MGLRITRAAIAGLVSAMALSSNVSAEGPLKVAFVGDPQADGLGQLEYCRRSVYKEIRERKDLDLVVFLGDMVNDDVSLLVPTKATLDSISCPWLCLPGNHDRDIYPKDSLAKRWPARDAASFTEVFGYSDTTLTMGGVTFVLLNDVQLWPKEYSAGLRDSQKRLLESALRKAPAESLVVLCAHIPFSEFARRDSLETMLASHPNTLMVCGHTHYASRHGFGYAGIEEVLAGAACGMFWTGAKGEDGLPSALMNCGAPRGYYVATFPRRVRPGRKPYSLEYKKVGGHEVATVYLTADNVLVANVFGGGDEGLARMKVHGMKGWLTLSKEDFQAVETLEVLERNKDIPRRIGKSRNPEYSPMRKWASPHVWAIRLDEKEAARLRDGALTRLRYEDASMSVKTRVRLKVSPLSVSR